MNTRKYPIVLLVSSLCLSLSSCVNGDYNLNKLDTTITIGGQNLTIPIGETENITFRELLSSVDQNKVQKLEDGTYAFKMNDIFDLSQDIPDLSRMFEMKDIQVSRKITHTIGKTASVAGIRPSASGNITIRHDHKVDFTILPAADIPPELVCAKRVLLNNVKAEFALSFTGLPDFGKNALAEVDLSIDLPEEVIPAEDPRLEGKSLHVRGPLVNNALAIDPLVIRGFDFSRIDLQAGKDIQTSFYYHCQILVRQPDVPTANLVGRQFQINESMRVINIKLSKIDGKVDYVVEPVVQNIVLDQVPEFMKEDGFVLDFTRPYLRINAITNIGVPAAGDLKLVPIYNGIKDPSRTVVLSNVEFPYTNDINRPAEAHFHIAGDRESCPADYHFIQSDLRSLFKKIPERVELVFEIRTLSQKDALIEPDARYELNVDYDFVVPLEFGEELNMQVSDTVSNLPAIVTDILETGPLKLKGEISNSLPLQMDMELQLLADDQTVIPLSQPATQLIAACGTDGSVTLSPLDLTLTVDEGTDLSRLTSFRLTFTVTSGKAAGIPVTGNAYVKAVIRLNAPEGITMDWSDLTSGNGSGNNPNTGNDPSYN